MRLYSLFYNSLGNLSLGFAKYSNCLNCLGKEKVWSGYLLMNTKHTNNLFLRRKMPRVVLDHLCIGVDVISCIYFGIHLKTGWM